MRHKSTGRLSLWRFALLCLQILKGLAAISCAAETTGNSESQTPKALGLADVRRIAFEKNWDLLAAKSGVDTATAQLIVAHEFPNPTVSWSTARIGSRDNSTDQGNDLWHRSYDNIAAVNQLIEVGGKRSSRQMSAKAGITGARARFFDARRLLEQGVTKAYIAALLAGENVQILKQSAASLRHEAEIAEARFKAGDISDSDRKQIENNADVLDLQARSAETAAIQARIAVEILMGVAHPRGDWKSAESLNDLSLVSHSTGEAKPEATRPDVLAAEADVNKAKADLRLQRAVRIPDPTFLVEFEHNPPGPNPPSDTIGVGVSFPLPLWNLNKGAIKTAQAALDQNALAFEKAKAQAAADIVNAEAAYQDATERLRRYLEQIKPRSAKVREAVAFAYQKGGASLVDLLTAERDDNSIRLATAQAMSDCAGAAADLQAARNVLPPSELNAWK